MGGDGGGGLAESCLRLRVGNSLSWWFFSVPPPPKQFS